ncbi:GDSL esterase/lipase, partial [Trifolium pratense]
GQHIGLSEPTLPYLSNELTGQKLLVGANFASAGIGILNDTGIQFVEILRMFQQFSMFEQYKERLSGEVGEVEASRIVNGALRLFELGARRVLVTGAGPLGCVPAQLATRSLNGECVNEIQQAAQFFNQLLFQLIKDLNTQLGSDVFIVADAYQMNMNFITNPQSFGFVTSKIACCGQGRFNGVGLCTALSNLCPNRDVYAFWDPFHPTQRALEFIVRDIFNGTSEFMSPMNLSTIMAMDTSI